MVKTMTTPENPTEYEIPTSTKVKNFFVALAKAICVIIALPILIPVCLLYVPCRLIFITIGALQGKFDERLNDFANDIEELFSGVEEKNIVMKIIDIVFSPVISIANKLHDFFTISGHDDSSIKDLMTEDPSYIPEDDRLIDDAMKHEDDRASKEEQSSSRPRIVIGDAQEALEGQNRDAKSSPDDTEQSKSGNWCSIL